MHILRRFHIRGTSFPPPGVATALWAVVCLLALAACRSSTGSESNPCGPGLIIPGVCIDGVKLGDSREQVRELLGPPSSIGWADGFYRAWRFYEYKPEGAEGMGFSIYFIEQPINTWGPVDALSVHEPYQGKTPEGLRIGSTLNEVKAAYGEPDILLTFPGESFDYTYCYDADTYTTFGIKRDTVSGFFIGFYIPMDQDTVYNCE